MCLFRRRCLIQELIARDKLHIVIHLIRYIQMLVTVFQFILLAVVVRIRRIHLDCSVLITCGFPRGQLLLLLLLIAASAFEIDPRDWLVAVGCGVHDFGSSYLGLRPTATLIAQVTRRAVDLALWGDAISCLHVELLVVAARVDVLVDVNVAVEHTLLVLVKNGRLT